MPAEKMTSFKHLFATGLALVMCCPMAPARAASEAVVHSFVGDGDGVEPLAAVINVGGTLYGTTYLGGSVGRGTVYSVTPAGVETVLYSFKGAGDGQFPTAGLTYFDGALYGTTFEGGSTTCAGGCGTVFKVTLAGVETVLHSFVNGTGGDGLLPIGSMVKIGKVLYGTTEEGGTYNGGTVFKITKSGVLTIVYSFGAVPNDGDGPSFALSNVGGTLYGTTNYGGTANHGTVYKMTPSGTETVLYSFQGGTADGAQPMGGVINVGDGLYGLTDLGGKNDEGTVYELNLTGAESVLYSFAGGNDGSNPRGSLINVKGKLYGTTYQGGGGQSCSFGCGTVFRVTKAGIEKVIYSFNANGDGAEPDAGFVNLGGTLYGTTSSGGSMGAGTVYSIKP